LKILKNRKQNSMNKNIERLIIKYNKIIVDNRNYYNFISNFNSGYIHLIHKHGHMDFWEDMDSTRHIE